MTPSLTHCLRADPAVADCPDVASWWPLWQAQAAHGPASADMALRGGFDADRVGWAFAAGYQAALRALCPQLPRETMAAFCVTEDGGNRPRDIRTRITAVAGGLRIDGAKRWTTLGPVSSCLLVVGAVHTDSERAALKVALVPADAAGVQLLPMPDTGFVPEVPHARVVLDGVIVPSLLGGDGYNDYVKPFRSIEDTHVTLAVAAYLLREARLREWPPAVREELAALLATFASLSCAAMHAPATHVVLAGALHAAQRLYAQADTLFGNGDDGARRWARDRALFQVAAGARGLRAERAWQRLAAGS